MTEQLREIREEINFLRYDVQKMQEWTTALEGRMSLVEDDLNPLKQEIRIISEKVNTYAFKIEDMKNRLCRNNVRIWGLPEFCEGSNPVGFMEKWLVGIFWKGILFPFFRNRASTQSAIARGSA